MTLRPIMLVTRGFTPLLPGKQLDPGLLAEQAVEGLGQSHQGDGLGPGSVETLPQGKGPVLQSLEEHLGHVVGVHVVKGFHPEVRELDGLSAPNLLEHHRIRVATGLMMDQPGPEI
jgi:hypothetical protein